MKTQRLSAALVLALCLAAPAARAADVGVSIQVSQPGVYGRIDIGRFPQPQVVVTQPVVIVPQPVRVVQAVQPVYLWVPPGHQKNWGKHCHRYNACRTPVYFVKDDWYHSHVMQGQPGQGRPGKPHPGKKHGKGHGKHKDD